MGKPDVEQKRFDFRIVSYFSHPNLMIPTPPFEFAARDSKQTIEEGLAFAPKFDENGLIVAMAVDAHTDEALMLAYMNEESLRLTLEKGQAVYWSRSRKEIWHKGATSGEFQEVVDIRTDCDQDALVLRVIQHGGGCCHTKRNNCFYRKLVVPKNGGLVKLAMVE